MKRPTMGVSLADLTDVPSFYQQQTLKLPAEVTTGVVVTDVMNNSPASKAGVQQYDVIVEMDGQKSKQLLIYASIYIMTKNW